jgi:phosphoribosyl 1,2-cyclic phosphodiesterase
MDSMPARPFCLQIKFWGVRGSTPTPSGEYLGYGGNTTCLEIHSGDGERIIIDAGTGIRELGRCITAENHAHHLDLFLTHFHWDHIQGIPFFSPLILPGNKVTFHSFPPDIEIQQRLQRQMSDPYFTLDFDDVGSVREFRTLDKVFRKGELSVTAFPLHHPQGAFGYRVESQGRSIVIATDLEHGDAVLDRTLRACSEGADLLIYDAQYTPGEYKSREGWGHSTYAEAARVARDAKVKQLMLFHHDPTHDDLAMGDIARHAAALFENTSAARELETVTLGAL